MELPGHRVWSSVIRSHLSVVYCAYFRLVRYYLLPLAIAGLIVPGLWLLTAFAILCTSTVDYSTKRSRIGRLTFLGFFRVEHLAYQVGVVAGCVRSRTLRSYLPSFRRAQSGRLRASEG
ncbi:MAG TPA: hypothetical protein VJP78_07200 [Thermoleophilia bacterium]|nr:hypothetical protein [Thermoleophilia bacterium]